MRKSTLVTAAFFLLHTVSFAQFSEVTSGTTQDLYAVHFSDVNTGYISGDSGVVLKTTDSGMSWSALTTGTTVSLRSISFVNNDTGYVGGSYYDTNTKTTRGVLLKTEDGGASWLNLNFQYEENLNHIFFLNADTGFVACSSDGLLRTEDGGTSWDRVSEENTTATFFPSELTGYGIMSEGVGKTVDGGANWTQIKDESSPDYNSADILESLYFTSDSIGYFGSPYYGGIYSTTDGGASLKYVRIVTIAIHFPFESTGYAITNYDGTTVHKTIDSGNSWSQIHENVTSLNDLFFVDDYSGIAVGEDGQILMYNLLTGTTAENNESAHQVAVFPNPVSRTLSVSLNEDIKVIEMTLHNSDGQQVAKYNGNQKTLLLNELERGVYYLQINTEQGTILRKITKE